MDLIYKISVGVLIAMVIRDIIRDIYLNWHAKK